MTDETRVVKIAVASTDTAGLDGTVSGHFGRCPAFIMAMVKGADRLNGT
jgi:predicted Fe-Mo cluster-binding NifX family protein